MTAVTPAERILLGLGIRHPDEIDLEAVAASRNAFVRYKPLDKCEAMIVGSKKAIILVNSHSREERQRFSLAHEMGHWHHHRGQVLYCGPNDVGNPAPGPLNPERQADEFASDLILPNYMFRPFLAKLGRVRLPEIREIAAEFRASLTATLIKTVAANRFSIVLACHNRRGLRWSKRADMVPGWWKLQQTIDPETFAGRMLFHGAAEEAWPRAMPADAWFEFRGADQHEVKEQSFLLPNDQVLTVLTLPSGTF
jgi:Zn-dependent peptidase ImmA (M78 family)